MVRNELCLLLTNICNKSCSYCLTDCQNISTPDMRSLDKEKLYKLNSLSLSSYTEISIAGGEPGLVAEPSLWDLFNYLYARNVGPEKILILTNGLFLKRYGRRFDMFCYDYHVTSADDFVDFSPLNLSMTHSYVVNDDNIFDLKSLLKTAKHVKIDVVLDKNLDSISDFLFSKLQDLTQNHTNLHARILDDLLITDIKQVFNSRLQLELCHKISKTNCKDGLTVVQLHDETTEICHETDIAI